MSLKVNCSSSFDEESCPYFGNGKTADGINLELKALFCCSFESPFEDDRLVQLELLTLDSVSGKTCCVSVIGSSSLVDAIKSR